MVTLEQIKSNISEVTSEQIGRCSRIIGQDGKAFYLVESESGEFDEHGPIEYKVSFSRSTGFTCTCPCGQHGFHRVRHPSGVCKHVRAAVACSIEEDMAVHEQVMDAAFNAYIEAERKRLQPIECQVPAWIMNARPAPHMRNCPREM